MLRQFIFASVCAAAVTAGAADYKALTFELTDGSVVQVGTENLTMIPADNMISAS